METQLNTTALYIGVFVYFACMIMVGFLVRKKAGTSEGYLVAGRQFTLLFNSAALTACFLGGSMILSLPGLTYGMGIWNDDKMWGATTGLGGIFCLLLAGLFYMPKLWRLKLLSMGDYFYLRFGKGTGFVVSLVTILTFIFWVAVQILVFAKVCSAFLGWSITSAAIIGIAVIAVYTTLGGLWAVMATDMVQVGLVALGIFVLTPIALGLAGGFDAVMEVVPDQKLQVFPEVSEPRVWVAWFASWCLIGIGSIVSPDLLQRAFAAKTASIARNSALVGMTIKTILSLLMILLACTGWALVNNNSIPESALGGDIELIVPVMVKTLLPLPLVILFVGAALSAVMGAASSALLAMSGMISKNVWKDVIRPNTTDKELVLVSRLCVVAFAIFAVYLALSLEMVYLLLALGFDLIMASLFAAMTLGLYWKKANEFGAIAGIIAGIGTRVIGAGLANDFTLTGIAYAGDWYVWSLVSPAVSFIVMIVVSLATQNSCPSNEYGFHYDADGDPTYANGEKALAVKF
ncbi:MAG: hypothetical protein IJD04_03540 [Desulfovibrionaceae bacterium]|nr:hypothetical protein [Desulfovibrionaceae bacterium]